MAQSQQISEVGDEYFFHYQFRNNEYALQEMKWQYNKWKINNYIHSFGLTPKAGNKFSINYDEIRHSDFYIKNGELIFRYDKIINDSRDITYPLYQKFEDIFNRFRLNRRDQLELIMRFLQDIPYEIPPLNYQNRYIGGLFPPSEIIKIGKGDCDSKAVLMASILSHDPFFYNKLAIIVVPGHALLGIETVPLAYDQYITYEFKKYVYAEPVGPARTPIGKTNSPYSEGIEVHPLSLFAPRTNQKSNNNSTSQLNQSSTLSNFKCPDGGLLISYERAFEPEIVKSCQLKINGEYLKHGPTRVFSKNNGQMIRDEMWSKGNKI